MFCFIKIFFNQMGKICVKIEKQKPIFDVDIVLSYKLFVHVATVYAVFLEDPDPYPYHSESNLDFPDRAAFFGSEPAFPELSGIVRMLVRFTGYDLDLPDPIWIFQNHEHRHS